MSKQLTYFTLSRTIFDSAIWRDNPHTLKLFIYLIGQARHSKTPKKFPTFKIKRGELVTSLSQIAENNSYMFKGAMREWSRMKVSRMLKTLEKQGYINILCDTYGTHISVCNYDTYQSKENYSVTGALQVRYGSVTGVLPYNKDKNGNNESIMSSKEILKNWNELADKKNLPSITTITKSRRDKFKVRSAESSFDYKRILSFIDKSAFLCGANNRNWKVSFDWILANDTNYVKILEGKYNNGVVELK